MTQATCGCWLKEGDEGTMIATKEYSRDGSHAVGFPVVCKNCLKWYKRRKLILTEQQKAEWLSSEQSVKESDTTKLNSST